MKILLLSLISFFISSHSFAGHLWDTNNGRADTTKSAPKSIRIFTNLYLPAQIFFADVFKSGEASVELWQKSGKAWVGEIGYAQRTRSSGEYRINGTYIRIGREVGFWERQPARRALGAWQMGLRLCGSVANYDIKSNVNITQPYWGQASFQDSKRGIFALWTESHISLRARLGRRFLMGPFLRVKLLLITPKAIFHNHPAEIVGYGVRRSIQGEAGYWVGFLLGK